MSEVTLFDKRGNNIKGVDGKTELTMVHSNIPTIQEKELRQGWIEYYWTPLKSYLEKLESKK